MFIVGIEIGFLNNCRRSRCFVLERNLETVIEAVEITAHRNAGDI